MKILSAETNIGTATTVSRATVVRVYNSDSSAGIVTRTDNSDTTIGNFTVPAGEVLYLQKKSTDKLLASSTVLASKVAYSHMMSYASYTSSGGGGGGGDNVVTDNMVVYLDAGNNSSYSGSGTSWNDISGNSNNFTLVNGPTYSSSDGGAIVLDGTNDYAISAINASFFAFGTAHDYSYGVWAKINSAENTESLLSCGTLDGGVTPNSFQMDFEGTNTRLRHLFRYSSAKVFKGLINIEKAIIRTTDVHNFSSASNTDGTFKIGVNRQLIAFVDGRIGQVHVYKGKALTASEVLDNNDDSLSRYGL